MTSAPVSFTANRPAFLEPGGNRLSASADGFRWAFRLGIKRIGLPKASETATFRRTPKLARLEAALFVAEEPLTARKLAQFATLADASESKRLIDELNDGYNQCGSPFRAERVAGGYQLLTRPAFAAWLDRLHERAGRIKLSAAAMETLTIIAYRQPVTRADVEQIRGVQSAEMLKQLLELGLVRIAGEDDSLGRPFLYETTRAMLEEFGLKSLDELPAIGQR